ncbi:hypothetical protein ACJJI5_13980 [Microbulbifer sp. EKSA008]|uniref:hypothetical protein n=1 Tax=unclassified Microbulbifer TaxID=2619833 RepID=UPI00403A4462
MAAGLVTFYSLYKICLSEYVNKDTASARNIVNFKKKIKLPTKKNRPLVLKYERKYKNSWSILIGVVIFIMGMAHFEKKGVQEARKILQNIKTDKNSRVIVQINGAKKELLYLYCGSRNCAAFNKKTNEIVYFPQSGHSYVRQKEI